jgi:hypothetical protein
MNSEFHGHGKLVCKVCRKVIAQCRCTDCAEKIQESLCDKCRIDITKQLGHLKILIACPTFALDPNPGKWLGSLMTIVMDLHKMNINFGFMFPYRKGIHKAENAIIQRALTTGYTHVLRLDDDVWGIQPGDVLKLIVADKDFISAVMFVRGFPFSRCAFRKVDPKMTLLDCEKKGRITLEEIEGEGVQPVDLTAFPFTLFKTTIYDKMTFPYFDDKVKGSPDSQFCQRCLDLGIQPYVHMDIQINHCDVTPWNRLFLYNSEARRLLMTKQIDPTSFVYKTLVPMFGEDGMKDLYRLKGTGHDE